MKSTNNPTRFGPARAKSRSAWKKIAGTPSFSQRSQSLPERKPLAEVLANGTESEAVRCYYCTRIIHTDDDSQNIEKGKPAHTSCAWRVNDDFFAALDAASEKENDDKL